MTELEGFIRTNVSDNTAASLYVSGAPGTGKTASLSHILSKLKVSVTVVYSLNIVQQYKTTALCTYFAMAQYWEFELCSARRPLCMSLFAPR